MTASFEPPSRIIVPESSTSGLSTKRGSLRAQRIYLSRRDEAVIRYALGRLSAVVIKRQNWDVFQAHSLRCALGFPSTLEDIALLLFTYHRLGYKPDLEQLAAALNLIVAEHLPLQHHSELAWALWLALYFKAEIACPLEREQVLNSGSTTLLLLMELAIRKQLGAKLDKRWLRSFARPELLFDEGWLFTYEAACRGWLPKVSGKSVAKSEVLFSTLHDNDVRFFEPDRLPEPLFHPRAGFEATQLDSDQDIGTEFDYSERTKGYQGPEVLVDADDGDEDSGDEEGDGETEL